MGGWPPLCSPSSPSSSRGRVCGGKGSPVSRPEPTVTMSGPVSTLLAQGLMLVATTVLFRKRRICPSTPLPGILSQRKDAMARRRSSTRGWPSEMPWNLLLHGESAKRTLGGFEGREVEEERGHREKFKPNTPPSASLDLLCLTCPFSPLDSGQQECLNGHFLLN